MWRESASPSWFLKNADVTKVCEDARGPREVLFVEGTVSPKTDGWCLVGVRQVVWPCTVWGAEALMRCKSTPAAIAISLAASAPLKASRPRVELIDAGSLGYGTGPSFG